MSHRGSFHVGFNRGAAMARPNGGATATEPTLVAEDDDDSSSNDSSMPDLIPDVSDDEQDFLDIYMFNGVPILTLNNPTRTLHFNKNSDLVEGLPPPPIVTPRASRHIDARYHYVRDIQQPHDVNDQSSDDHHDMV
jgi:hypothetical protein